MRTTPTPLASASTAPSHGAHHPAALAFHAINDAAQLLIQLLAGQPPHVRTAEVHAVYLRRMHQRLADAAEQLSAMQILLERQERVIEEQRVQAVRHSMPRPHSVTINEAPRSSVAGGK